MYDLNDIQRGDYVVLRDDSEKLTKDVTGWREGMATLTASNGEYDHHLALKVTRVETEDGWFSVATGDRQLGRVSFSTRCILRHITAEEAREKYGQDLSNRLTFIPKEEDMAEKKNSVQDLTRLKEEREDESEPTVSDERMRELILSATGDVEDGLTQDEVICIMEFARSYELPEVAKRMIEDGELRTAVDMHGGVVLVDDTAKKEHSGF